MSAVFKYILDFKANTEKVTKEVGGMQGMLKGAAVAAGALFAVDKAMEAAAAVAEYAKEISNTKIAVETLTGVHGAMANQMAGEMTAIAQSYGVDVTEAIKSSNVIMKSFGMTSKDAFDLLNVGMSGAAAANGDLLQQVAEYSPHFKEAGLTAQQMFSVIAEGNKAGVFDDKTADMIKEGSIRMREMTQSTKDAINGLGLSATEIQRAVASGSMTSFEAMQKVSNKLKEFPAQSSQVGAALADIFGGPGEDGVNFVRILGDIDLSMQGLVDGATKAQMEYTDALAEFHTVGATVFGGTGEMMMKLKTIGMDMVNGLIKGTVSVINYFIDLYNESAVVRGAFEYMGLVVKTAFNYIAIMLKDLVNKFTGIGKVLKAIFTGDFGAIAAIVKETFATSAENAEAFGKQTADNFSKAVQNTLNPREKIKMISFDTEATEAGTSAGTAMAKATAAQMANAFKGQALPAMRDTTPLATMSSVGVSVSTDGLPTPETLAPMTLAIQGAQEQMDGLTNSTLEMSDTIANAVSGIGGNFQAIGDAIGGTAGSWVSFAGKVLSSIPGLIANITALTAAQGSNAIAGAVSGSAALPPPFNIISIAASIAAVVAGLATAVPMANGGILYGPTNILAGEYPGARSNPEVVAPLSKLQTMIGDRSGGSQKVQVEVVGNISGDTINLASARASRRKRQYNG